MARETLVLVLLDIFMHENFDIGKGNFITYGTPTTTLF